MIIGSPSAMNSMGISYLIYGRSTGFNNIDLANTNSDQFVKILGANTGDQSGYSVSGADDVNQDEYKDVLIGPPLASYNSKKNSGVIYVIYGSKNISDIDISQLSYDNGFLFMEHLLMIKASGQ